MEGKPTITFLLGGPGSGKGTQSERLVKEHGFVHLSAGDLLREERKSGSPDGELIESYIRDGKIVPSEITVKLLENAMRRNGWIKQFLIDGFPRNEENYSRWFSLMGDKTSVAGCLFFDCPDDILLQRVMERAKDSGRVDDNIDSFKKRLVTYHTETKPVVDKFGSEGLLLKVDATPAVETVFEEVKKILKL
eukprot:TRINITY_DN1043_c0_g1_i1.p2 TRINITY_DN1043_c0_g1~~TRINITY_DN1043_c0_g1_i1.p2  ORF type:complete len:192 (+),score=67.60 TRINITY_DN1043_c0_g1_i1:54-629(+)